MNNQENVPLLQIAHGKIIPEYSSAYALRCIRYLEDYPNRKVVSVGGLTFRDDTKGDAKQYRSLIMTAMAFLRGGRMLEILLSKGSWLRRKYMKDLKKELAAAEVVIFEGPWQYLLVKDLLLGKKVIYDAHNVEYILRKGSQWEGYTRSLELELIKRSDHVITVSQEDADIILSTYGKELPRVTPIPEGFELPKEKWKGVDSNEIVFIGSAYLPNIMAASNVIKLAKLMPEFTFKIIGSVCSSVKKGKNPRNVKLLGVLPNENKEFELCNSFLAINPVEIGSGRNLKMNDYIAHGVPIITTEVGARGFEQLLRDEFIITEITNFPEMIHQMKSDRIHLMNRSQKLMNYAHEHNYSTTKEKAIALIHSLVR